MLISDGSQQLLKTDKELHGDFEFDMNDMDKLEAEMDELLISNGRRNEQQDNEEDDDDNEDVHDNADA
ncbi:hypothetical protein OC834_003991 [Tilletia horrida]|nr:hypothetical protein OC834_003991 [Tilletia horrida]